ncbi:MAG: NADH:ubiquinone reductase (Na(+)-transporting) subunit B [Bacteroidales bacterium]|jgi:Na+-transporting NADH:ubiquinone oxidoreductase subunit B|nr:NADH:ubiquinone reductase (Na(+)-transporting) subunit B [Bacteroidales bacterium]MBQ6101121.1 NADH:ubiquinone reductase (Na(+)-transporting) subunit B [Bacteroidales bacterium]
MFNNLRRFFDKLKPTFSEGGKLAKLESTFEAFETFAFTPNHVTKQGCHVRDAVDLKRAMITVVIALIPAMLFGMWNIGYQHYKAIADPLTSHLSILTCFWFGFLRMLPLLAVSYIVGLTIEFAFAQIRHHQVNEGFLVTGFLIPMIVPVTTPLWQLAIATAFAVIIGKEVFGGTGMNFLNPALVARAFLFFSYPTRMSGDSVWIAADFWGTDAITSATPLAELAAGLQPTASALDMFIGTIPGSTCETSVIAILLGAILLLISGIASWRIMLSVIIGGGLMGIIFNLLPSFTSHLSPLTYFQLPFYYHYLMGGFMFGAVFMATDPVTAAQTNIGKWIYGLLIGIFAVMLRVINPAYPEGMMLSILLMNCFAPLIDHCVVAHNIKRRQKRAIVKSKSSAR